MESIKTWITTICASVFFITAVEIILPDNSFKKYAKFVLGLILMITIINPMIKVLSGKNINLSSYLINEKNILESEETKANQYRTENIKSTQNVFEENIQKIILNLLQTQYPKNTFQVKVKTYYEVKSNTFSIESVEILLQEGKIKKIKKVNINEETNETVTKNEKDDREMKSIIKNNLNIEEKVIHIYSEDN